MYITYAKFIDLHKQFFNRKKNTMFHVEKDAKQTRVQTKDGANKRPLSISSTVNSLSRKK